MGRGVVGLQLNLVEGSQVLGGELEDGGGFTQCGVAGVALPAEVKATGKAERPGCGVGSIRLGVLLSG